MHHFATPLRPGQQRTRSLRASKYRHASKRKRDDGSEEPPSSPERDAQHHSAPNTPAQTSFAPVDAEQLRVAGLLPGDAFEIPPAPFPHTPAPTPKERFTSSTLQKQLASLNPPLYAPTALSQSHPVDGEGERPRLRLAHLEVMTTVMHRCLLAGDYERAGIAWGIILRTRIAGRSIDPRIHGRWGIGAEILLHRDPKKQSARSQSADGAAPAVREGGSLLRDADLFSEEGFERAREYYDLLIVQYPWSKTRPHAIDEMTFYPAMFSLWVFEVCEKSRQARRQHDSTEDTTTFTTSDDSSLYGDTIRENELAQARDIAARLDELISSPPHDTHTDLLHLRGNIGFWIADLVVGKRHVKQEEDEWSFASREDYVGGNREWSMERQQKCTESATTLRQAQDFFARAQKNGARVDAAMAALKGRIIEIEEEIHRVRG